MIAEDLKYTYKEWKKLKNPESFQYLEEFELDYTDYPNIEPKTKPFLVSLLELKLSSNLNTLLDLINLYIIPITIPKPDKPLHPFSITRFLHDQEYYLEKHRFEQKLVSWFKEKVEGEMSNGVEYCPNITSQVSTSSNDLPGYVLWRLLKRVNFMKYFIVQAHKPEFQQTLKRISDPHIRRNGTVLSFIKKLLCNKMSDLSIFSFLQPYLRTEEFEFLSVHKKTKYLEKVMISKLFGQESFIQKNRRWSRQLETDTEDYSRHLESLKKEKNVVSIILSFLDPLHQGQTRPKLLLLNSRFRFLVLHDFNKNVTLKIDGENIYEIPHILLRFQEKINISFSLYDESSSYKKSAYWTKKYDFRVKRKRMYETELSTFLSRCKNLKELYLGFGKTGGLPLPFFPVLRSVFDGRRSTTFPFQLKKVHISEELWMFFYSPSRFFRKGMYGTNVVQRFKFFLTHECFSQVEEFELRVGDCDLAERQPKTESFCEHYYRNLNKFIPLVLDRKKKLTSFLLSRVTRELVSCLDGVSDFGNFGVYTYTHENGENVRDVIIELNDKVTCRFCEGSKGHLKRCSGCSNVHYCNRKCQTKDWERHRVYCKE